MYEKDLEEAGFGIKHVVRNNDKDVLNMCGYSYKR